MKKEFTQAEARIIGEKVGIDFYQYDLEEFRKGYTLPTTPASLTPHDVHPFHQEFGLENILNKFPIEEDPEPTLEEMAVLQVAKNWFFETISLFENNRDQLYLFLFGLLERYGHKRASQTFSPNGLHFDWIRKMEYKVHKLSLFC